MEDVAVRLACLDAAVRCTGNPNHLTLAREFYTFATEGGASVPADKTMADAHTSDELKTLSSAPKGKKGTVK